MKKTTLCISGIMLVISMAGCAGNGTTTTKDSTVNTVTTNQMNPGDSAVTTTTTTTVVHHRYSGNFVPQATTKYLDLQTNKKITVRIDTVRGEVVNAETNEPVNLFVEPTTHDTIYGQTGSVVNNYIIHEDGDYKVDTVRINTTETTPAPAGKEKIKEKNNGEKIKEKSK